jgi:hypothetical protein
MAGRRKKRKTGHKQHLFDHGEPVDPEFLLVHRELELLRAGARVKRSRPAHTRHMAERARKLEEAKRKVGQ